MGEDEIKKIFCEASDCHAYKHDEDNEKVNAVMAISQDTFIKVVSAVIKKRNDYYSNIMTSLAKIEAKSREK